MSLRGITILALVATTAVVVPPAGAAEQKTPPAATPPTTKEAAEQKKPPAVTPPAQKDASPSAERTPTKPAPVITLKDGRLTLQVENLPLEWVLEEISRKAQIAIVRGPGLEGDRITRKFQDLPVDEALRQILTEHDSFFFFGVGKKAPAVLRVVWVYQRAARRRGWLRFRPRPGPAPRS
jgi:hypothetical protein